jgi:hypothetical protein
MEFELSELIKKSSEIAAKSPVQEVVCLSELGIGNITNQVLASRSSGRALTMPIRNRKLVGPQR